MILVNNKHEESKEDPRRGNLFFNLRDIFSKKKCLESISGKNNYDWNRSGCSGVFSSFILGEEKRLETIVSKWNCKAFRKIKCLME